MGDKEDLRELNNENLTFHSEYNPSCLKTLNNGYTDHDYYVKLNCPEFTSLCPVTGQPNFATITISYIPNKMLVESMSLKLYLSSFRNQENYHEDCVNIIMKDLITLLDPKYIEVTGKFLPRGGISVDPYCNYGKPDTSWEQFAWDRLKRHDMHLEKVDNR